MVRSQNEIVGNLNRFVSILPVAIAILVLVVSCDSKPSLVNAPLDGKVDLQGHRGARGLKPENTWPAFEEAIKYEMTTLELDTVLTKDHKIVIHHDSETNPEICRKKDGQEIISVSLYELNLADLKLLDCGAKQNPKFSEQQTVPGTQLLTIEEFFYLVAKEEAKRKGRLPLQFNIETKFPNDEKSEVSSEIVESHVSKLIQAIENAKVETRTTIQSFYLPSIELAKKLKPNLRTSALFTLSYVDGAKIKLGLGDSLRKKVIESARGVKADIISPHYLYVNDQFVSDAHSFNLRVIPWTVNEPLEMERLLKAGVDGIISDYPDRLASLVRRDRKN
ncbi:glycerophosphodiester phosphodiesterase family protein [Leptospira perolatii]|uniref:glycerophosphodiester phosphodiesterase family protein n=1 Tax=Leptospira perolatii TaxID=2023191 RepID=UPI003C6DB3F8